MIAVGDHRLQLARSGTGPTVVFEAGMSDKLDQPDLVLGAIRWVVAAGRWPR